MSEFKVLEIGIVGAGIAGLSAAIALTRSGHNVEIFEQSQFANEIGAAINVTPNAVRVLELWGFDFDAANPTKAEGLLVKDSDFQHTLHHISMKTFPEKFGARYLLYHRADLHNGLKALAYKNGATIRTSSQVSKIDCESGEIVLTDGSVHHKDLVIAADGIHSTVVKYVTGQDTQAVPTGESAFRWLIPDETLREDPKTREIIEASGDNICISVCPGKRMVWYSCRGGKLWNFVGIHADVPGRQTAEEWNTPGSIDDLLSTYEGFGEGLLTICKRAEGLKLWKLLFRRPLDTWTKGKVVLVGDACHPMLPHMGQGGAQSIEDGAALGELFAQVNSVDEIPSKLELFQSIRRDRCSAIQFLSNAGQDEAKKVERDVKPYVKDGKVPSNHAEINEFNFAYDIMKESRLAIKKAGERAADVKAVKINLLSSTSNCDVAGNHVYST